MARKVSPAIFDILQTIERVEGTVSGKSFAEFQSNWEFRFAVQRAIEVISEASRRLPENFKAARSEIDWRRIAGIGNILRHEYHSVSDKVIWDVVQQEFPALKVAVEAIGKMVEE